METNLEVKSKYKLKKVKKKQRKRKNKNKEKKTKKKENSGQEDQEKKVLICPITLETIKKPVATMCGQIYEDAALTKWMQQEKSQQLLELQYFYLPDGLLRLRDPLTNLWIPFRKYSLKVDEKGILTPGAKEFVKYLRSTQEYGDFYGFLFRRYSLPQVHLFQKQLKNLLANDLIQWPKVQIQLVQLLLEKKYDAFCQGVMNEQQEKEKGIIRPKVLNNIKGFQYIDMTLFLEDSKGMKKDKKFSQLAWKGLDIRGGSLKNFHIHDSDLARINLTGCDLRGTIFSDVTFVGDETCFEGSLMDEKTSFINCLIEPLGSWTPIQEDSSLIKHHLVARGANPCCSVTVCKKKEK